MKRKMLSAIGALLCCIWLVGCVQPAENKTDLPEIKYTGFHNLKNSFAVCDENYVYAGNHHYIYRAPKGTGDFECIYSDENLYINKIALGSDRIYFSSVEKLYSTDKNGQNVRTVAEMAIPGGRVLWDTFYVFEDNVYLKKGSKISAVGKETSAENIIFSENTYINSRGMEYEFIRRGERPEGTLAVKATGSTIPAEGAITGETSFIFTDDYIFYITGEETDFNCSLSLCRCLPDGRRQQKITDYDTPLNLIYRDSENLYYHNYEYFFILNQKSGEITKTAFPYLRGNVYEVCDGKLFRVYTLERWAADFATGETVYLADVK